MADETRADRYISRIKNNKWLSLAIVAGFVFIALVSFAKSFQEAGAIFGDAFSQKNVSAAYDASTKEALLATAREIDYFFLKLETSSHKIAYSEIASDYIRIKADLRSILLRNMVRPLNDLAVKQSELLLEGWSEMEELLRQPEGTSPAFFQHKKEAQFMMFKLILFAEEMKKSNHKAH